MFFKACVGSIKCTHILANTDLTQDNKVVHRAVMKRDVHGIPLKYNTDVQISFKNFRTHYKICTQPLCMYDRRNLNKLNSYIICPCMRFDAD